MSKKENVINFLNFRERVVFYILLAPSDSIIANAPN